MQSQEHLYPYGEKDIRIKKSAQQILAVAVELNLTIAEFEKAIQKIKCMAYLKNSNSLSDKPL